MLWFLRLLTRTIGLVIGTFSSAATGVIKVLVNGVATLPFCLGLIYKDVDAWI